MRLNINPYLNNNTLEYRQVQNSTKNKRYIIL